MNTNMLRQIVRNLIEDTIAQERPEEVKNQWKQQEQGITTYIETLNSILESDQIEQLITSDYSLRIKNGLLKLKKNIINWDNEYNNNSPIPNNTGNNISPYQNNFAGDVPIGIKNIYAGNR